MAWDRLEKSSLSNIGPTSTLASLYSWFHPQPLLSLYLQCSRHWRLLQPGPFFTWTTSLLEISPGSIAKCMIPGQEKRNTFLISLLSLGLLLFFWGEWCEKWFYCSNHSLLYTILFIQQTFLSAYYVPVPVVEETFLFLTLWILQSGETYTNTIKTLQINK